jgi:NAD(P)H dehydrogenase (quinone)
MRWHEAQHLSYESLKCLFPLLWLMKRIILSKPWQLACYLWPVFFLIIGIVPSYAQDHPLLIVTYYSQSGNTERMAKAIADGAAEVQGVKVLLAPLDSITLSDLEKAGGIILGSPVYNGNPAPEVLAFINSWPFEGRSMKDKIGAAFATGGGISIGEEHVLLSILRGMLIHGMLVIGGETVEAAFGASAITGEGPFSPEDGLDPLFIRKGEQLGKRVAALLLN